MGSQLAWWLPSRLRLIPTTWVDTSVSPSDPPLVWTPSPRDLMLLPRELLLMLMDTTDMDTMDLSMERDPLTPTTLVDMLLFPSDLPLVLTPSPRDLMLLLRDMPLSPTTDTDTTDLSMERDPLMLMLTTASSDTMEFTSDPPLVLTPSPRDLMPLPKDMLLMLMDTTDTDTMDLSTERDLLMLRLIPTTDSDTPLSPSGLPLV